MTPRMSAREPLPYPHVPWLTEGGYALACTESEGLGRRDVAFSAKCPGCLAASITDAVKDPFAMMETPDGEWVRAIDDVRGQMDDFHPLRVLFERALRDRGIA